MSNRGRMLLAALVAALTLAAGASLASANNEIGFSVAEGELGRVRLESRRVTFTAEGEEIICYGVFATTLHSTMAKVAATLVGSVTEVTFTGCESAVGATFRAQNIPWHVTYQSFSGTLPSITALGLRMSGVALLIEAFAGIFRCLYRGAIDVTTVGSPIAEFRISAAEFPSGTRLGEGICPGSLSMRGALVASPRVRMTLGNRCATSPAVRVDEAFQRQEGSNATIGMTAQIECDNTRIDSIRTTRANESIGIEDRERAVGRTFRRGERFRYDLRLTAREGTRVVEENVEIAWTEEGGSGRSTTRVRFTDL